MFLIITLTGILLYLNGFKYYGLAVFLFLLTDGFQFIPEPLLLFGLNLYGKDYALVFSLTIFLSYLITGKIAFPYKCIIFKSLLIFLLFLAVAVIVDLLYYNPSIAGFLLIFRINLFFLTFFWLSKIDRITFDRIFRLIFIITVIQSVLCLLQIPLGVRLLTLGGISQFNELGFNWVRYTNTPFFIFPCLFIVLIDKSLKIANKNYIIVLFFTTILFTLTRTLILGLVLTIALSVLFGLFKQQKKVVVWMTVLFILSLPIIGARIMSSTEDINTAVTEDTVTQGTNMTFAYRIFHMTERFLFINQDLKHQVFGVGFIHERDFPPTTFFLGHKVESGTPTQLDQDDIAWSNLFLRYGIVGTFLYTFVFIAFCIVFFAGRKSPFSSASFMFMVMSFILTFASGRFSQADFFVVPMFLFFYLLKTDYGDAKAKKLFYLKY